MLSLTLTASPLAFATDAKIMFRFPKTAGDVVPLSGIVFETDIIYVGDIVDQVARLTSSGNGSIKWSSNGDLPDGLAFSSAGRLQGRASRAGNFGPISLFATDSLNQVTNSSDISIAVFALPAATDIVANVPVHQARTIPLQVTGGGGGMTAAIKSGNLPDGMQLSGLNITGTPSRADRYEAVIEFTDRNGRKTAAEVHLEVLNDLEIATSFPDAYVGAAYNGGFTAIGGSGAFAWTLNSEQVPGLSFGASTGLFTGTPTVSGSYPVDATLFDHPQSMNASGALSVFDQPVLSAKIYPDAYKGEAYSNAGPSLSGGKGPFQWKATGLPSGFIINANSGAISASSTDSLVANSPANFTISAEDLNGKIASNSYSVTAYNLPQISDANLADGYVGTAMTATSLAVVGGKAPIAWSISNGNLPAGVTLSSAGVISGTPTASGAYSFTARAADSNGRSATKPMNGTVHQEMAIAAVTVPDGYAGSALANVQLSASGGKAPYIWAVQSGTLPAGITLSATGLLSGTPTTAGTSTFTIEVADANSKVANRQISMNVNGALAIASNLPASVLTRSAVSSDVVVTGGKAPFTIAVDPATLPTGLSFSGNKIVGTPTVVGSKTVAYSVVDANGKTASRSQPVTVNAGTISATMTAGNGSVTLQQFFNASDWTDVNVNKQITLPAGSVRGSTTAGSTAVTIGTSAWGGALTFNVNGEIQGASGAANSGVGGTAFNAERLGNASQKINLVVNGAIRAGGGGGGKGGTGGTGGGGVFAQTTTVREPASGEYYNLTTAPMNYFSIMNNNAGYEATWNYVLWPTSGISLGGLNSAPTSVVSGIYTYYRGTFRENAIGLSGIPAAYYGVYRTYQSSQNVNSNGGTGGAGGNGGAGMGYSLSTVGGGVAGANGVAGGTNAGAGGKGGTGGTGGGWGATGNTGATGATGTNGNRTNGLGGVAGAGGGAAGFGIQNSGNVNRTGAGAVQGR